jgi:hypothetical protein
MQQSQLLPGKESAMHWQSGVATSLAAMLCASSVGLAAPLAKLTTSRCVDIEPAKLKRTGDRWLLLTETLVRPKPAPDFRVQQVQWTLLGDADGKQRTVVWDAQAHAAAIQARLGGRELFWTNRAGQIFDRLTVELATVSDNGETLQLNLTYRETGSDRTTLLPALVHLPTGKLQLGEATDVPTGKGFQHSLRGVGHDAAGRWIWFLAAGSKDTASATLRYDLHFWALSASGVSSPIVSRKDVVRAGNAGVPSHRWRWSADRSVLALAEYQEQTGAEAVVYVLQVAPGVLHAVPAPATTYVLDFSADGQRLLLGSNREGTLTLYDWAGQKPLKTARVGGQMHRGGFGPGGQHIWLIGRNAPLLAFDAATLKPAGKAEAAAIFGPGGKGSVVAELDLPTSPQAWAVALTDDKSGFGAGRKVCWVGGAK